jgi:NAD(P)-dependent dehydrogenase (short-subunit alcohol dehydrogenase family)
MARFKDKTVLVTGGSSGIGQMVTLLFAREGAKVIFCGRSEAGGEETMSLLQEEGYSAHYIQCDVSKSSQVERMFDNIEKQFGRLDAAINNAGIRSEHLPTALSTEENWDNVININLKGVWLCMKHEIQLMLKHDSGAIVNTSSVVGDMAIPDMPAYVAAKHGVNGLTKSAALEYAHHEKGTIRINAVAPAYTLSPMQLKVLENNPQLIKRRAAVHPLGRLCETHEVGKAILWLCSDEASFITGAILPIDGGILAGRIS